MFTSIRQLVTQFLAAGAIPFVKTNIPQTMFAFECSNPVWGRTTNPHNDKYTSGGSTGGEGALLAMDGSVIGIGSDIGGSLRIPAAYCGIYSLKPATGRISFAGAQGGSCVKTSLIDTGNTAPIQTLTCSLVSIGPAPGFEGIKTVAGPMSRYVSLTFSPQ